MTINRREKKVMQKRGLTPTPASGALSGWKGDATDELWACEYKYTKSKQYILKVDTWNKIAKEAIQMHKEPRMEIEFEGEGYLIVLSKDTFDEMNFKLKEKS